MEEKHLQSVLGRESSCCSNLELCKPGFVAINSIRCERHYIPRFKELFQTRAHAIDQMLGFLSMVVLEPKSEGEPYLVVSYWKDEEAFNAWTGSEAFRIGHKRAFEDLRQAKERGETPMMHSTFQTYCVVAE